MIPGQTERRRHHTRELLEIALDAVNPYQLMEQVFALYQQEHSFTELINPAGPRNLLLLGAGKAIEAMSSAVFDRLGPRIVKGLLIGTAPDIAIKPSSVDYFQGGHPLPTSAGTHAVVVMREMLANHDIDSLRGIIVLVSGGGSSLMTLPEPPLSLSDIRVTTELMLKSGADIHEMNTVRKHLLVLAGGKLLRHTSVRPVLCFILSDVLGDDLTTIASGPTVPDPSTFRDVWTIINTLGLHNRLPPTVSAFIKQGLTGMVPETPKHGDPLFTHTHTTIIGSNEGALNAIAGAAQRLGYHPIIAKDLRSGSVSSLVAAHLSRLEQVITSPENKNASDTDQRFAIISGGEATVNVSGTGRGGRNLQFVLEMVRPLAGLPVCVLSAGTDGIDGSSNAAGAIADGHTLSRANGLGMAPEPFCDNNDAHNFFAQLDDLIVIGPTGTNVMDVRIILYDTADSNRPIHSGEETV